MLNVSDLMLPRSPPASKVGSALRADLAVSGRDDRPGHPRAPVSRYPTRTDLTPDNFKGTCEFEGEPADQTVRAHYIGKSVRQRHSLQ